MEDTEDTIVEIVFRNLNQAVDDTLDEQFKHVGNSQRDFSRFRVLSIRTIIMAILAMQGNTLEKELLDLRIPVSVSGFSQSREKIDSVAFRDILNRFNANCEGIDTATHKGYRLWAIDGTAYNLPLSVLKECGEKYRISAPKSEMGFYAQTHLVLLYDLLNKTYVDIKESFDECGALYSMLYSRKFEKPTILTLDRGFASYNSLAHLASRPNLFFVMRVKQEKTALRGIAALPMEELDKDLSVELVTTQRNEDKAAGRIYMSTGTKKKGKVNSPKTRITRWDFADRADENGVYTLRFRVVRILLDSGEYETLATNLPREEFDANAIKALYRARWGIETSFRELKYSVGAIRTHSKRINSIMQEVYAALIVQNCTNRIARAVVIEQKADRKYTYTLNNKMANYIMRLYLRDHLYGRGHMSGEEVMRLMSHYTVPIKPNRRNTRNLRAKGFAGYTYRIT